MTNLNLAFYAGGIISYEDYAVFVFQPEPHQENDKIVSALIVEKAIPTSDATLSMSEVNDYSSIYATGPAIPKWIGRQRVSATSSSS